MKALGMRAKGFKHLWLWKLRWWYLFIVGIAFAIIPIIVMKPLYDISDLQSRFFLVAGSLGGMFICSGMILITFLTEYAIKRIKLGRKVPASQEDKKLVKELG